MGKNIFITYKYGDRSVSPINSKPATTVRDYVDELQGLLKEGNHINKGELDGQDLSHFKDSTIESKLRDKIFASSITIIMISKNMREVYTSEDNQWIPWEISYSLKEHSRGDRASSSNALIAVVLPDESGNDSYYWHYSQACNSIMYNINGLFKIIRENMFNLKKPSTSDCNGNVIHNGAYSYVYSVRWGDFVLDIDKHLDIALERSDKIEDYDINKSLI